MNAAWPCVIVVVSCSVQVHRPRAVRPARARLLHLHLRQVDADQPEDAAPLGRGQHHRQVLKVQEADQGIDNHGAALQVVPPHGTP